jgi:hypothetical protein
MEIDNKKTLKWASAANFCGKTENSGANPANPCAVSDFTLK